jgi:hypothetical protein
MDIGADQGHGIRILYAGRTGMLMGDELSGQMHLSLRQAEQRELPTARYGMPSEDSSFLLPPADTIDPTRCLLEALIAGRDYPTGEQGRAAIATLVAAHVSDQDGHREVSTGQALPRELEFQYP